MEIDFIGGAYSGKSTNINAQTCENFYVSMDKMGGKSVLSLIGTPGSKIFFESGGDGECRGLIEWEGSLYAVIKSTLWKIDQLGAGSNVGTLETTTGQVFLAGGLDYMALTDGSTGYYRTAGASSLTTITDADFPTAPTSIAYLNGRFIVTRGNTDEFYISASEDPSSWAGLDFASAEDQPDDALVGISHNREYWIIGERTAQAFVGSANTAFPIMPVSGAVSPTGTRAPRSVAAGPEGLFFLSHLNQVVARNGYAFQPISTEQIDYHIAQYGDTSDAVGFTYTQEGHSFYVITFPGAAAKATWAYDVTTGLWARRSTGTMRRRYLAQCGINIWGKAYIGGYDDGNIYELDLNTYTDNGETIVSERTCQTIHSGRKFIAFHDLEIEFEAGVGLVTGQGSNPQAMLQWSNDGGHTWSNEHWVSIGAIGNYTARAIWRRLGIARQRIFRVRISDPVKRVIIGATLNASAGNA